jgi:hypothetical protein
MRSAGRSGTGGAWSLLLRLALGRRCGEEAPHLQDHHGRTVSEVAEPVCTGVTRKVHAFLSQFTPALETVMTIQTFGVDISARWFDVAHVQEVRRFANTASGITGCLDWLATFGTPVRVGMEATGSYHLPLASALHAAGHVVLVCNPLSIARYSQAVLARTKTDATDARRIARFCEAHDLPVWTPASPAQQHLRALVTARETLVQERLRQTCSKPMLIVGNWHGCANRPSPQADTEHQVSSWTIRACSLSCKRSPTSPISHVAVDFERATSTRSPQKPWD